MGTAAGRGHPVPPSRSHPIQQAWAAEQVSQCGFCEPGVILAIAALLKANPRPSDAEIEALPNICRCGIGLRMNRAIARAAMSISGGDSLNEIAHEVGPQPFVAPEQRFSNGSSAESQIPAQ